MTLAKLLASLTKRTTPRTAAQLREDLGKIDMAALESRVAAIESERHDLLLQGSDADLAKNRQALDAANLDVERARAGLNELNRQIAEAERREASAEIEAQAAEAAQAVDQLANIYSEIDVATHDLAELFTQASTLANRVDAWNRRGHSLGQARLMFTPVDIVKQRTRGAI